MESTVVATNGSTEKAKEVKEVSLMTPELALALPEAIAGVKVDKEDLNLARIILTATALSNQYNFADETEVEKVKLSPKAKKVKSYIEKSDFNCRTETVAGLMSILLGEKLDIKTKDDGKYITNIFGAVLVPKNAEDSNYEVNEPFVLVDASERRGIRADGSRGNHASYYVKRYRKTTPEDLVKVFSNKEMMDGARTYLLPTKGA